MSVKRASNRESGQPTRGRGRDKKPYQNERRQVISTGTDRALPGQQEVQLSRSR